jgi:FdhE protein
MHDHIDYFASAEKNLSKTKALNPESIEFYGQIFNYLQKYYNIYKDNSSIGSIEISEDMPLIRSDKVSLSDEFLSILFKALIEIKSIIENHHKGMNLEIIADTIERDRSIMNDWIKSLLSRNIEELKNTANRIKLGTDEFIFLLVNTVKPLFICIQDDNKEKIAHKEWLSSVCPFCGYYPDMAKIVDSLEGKRFLHCALCEHEWPFERLSCIVCGNKVAEKLGYYVTESKTPYRIDYCEECNAYIKTIRIPKDRDPDKYDLYVENIITPYLDYLALEKGLLKQ